MWQKYKIGSRINNPEQIHILGMFQEKCKLYIVTEPP